MAIQRSQWHRIQLHLLGWSCSRCVIGRLKFKEKTKCEPQTRDSRERYILDEISEEQEYLFSAILICDNNLCKEPVVISGAVGEDSICEIGPDGEPEPRTIERYTIKYFNPPPALFAVPGRTPKSVKDRIRESASLYWADLSSAANKLRVAAESIMTEQGVPSKDHKGKFISLTKRLNEYAAKDYRAARYLIAIKWIGNEGSHEGEVLSDNDYIDGLDLMKHALEEIYGDNKNIEQIAQKILKRNQEGENS